MEDGGLVQGTSGNLSARSDGAMLITPSAMPCGALDPDDLVVMELDGSVRTGDGPSTEWRLHASVYRGRPEVQAVLHAHPPFCTALSCLRREIPAFHYMVVAAGGGSIRCAPYAAFGTEELADRVMEALEGRRACLMANHGMVALGSSVGAAVDLALEVESLAEIYWRAVQIGEPSLLSPDQIGEVLDRMTDYRSG